MTHSSVSVEQLKSIGSLKKDVHCKRQTFVNAKRKHCTIKLHRGGLSYILNLIVGKHFIIETYHTGPQHYSIGWSVPYLIPPNSLFTPGTQ